VGRRTRTVLAAIASVIAIAGATATLVPGHRATGKDAPNPQGQSPADTGYMTVHGPNDGEPLNNWVRVDLQVSARQPSYLLVFGGRHYLYSCPVTPQDGSLLQSVQIPLDSTRFINGPVTVTFYLYDQDLSTLLGARDWTVQVQNPWVETIGLGSEGKATIRLHGNPGEVGYVVALGQDPADLLRPPPPTRSPQVRLIASGQYSVTRPDGSPSSDLVIDLDDLARLASPNGFLILWSVQTDLSWSHSRPIPFSALSQVGSPQKQAPAGGGSTGYGR
jgi:hypothetical protein